jgi:hypothetical protein
MKTVAILEGWAGGPRLTKIIRSALKEGGYELIKNPAEADIIIAHSTGSYMLPETIKANLVILINPPYWPGESIVKRWIRMNKDELKFLRKTLGSRRFFINKLWEVFYIVAKPSYTWSVLKNQSHLDFLENLKDKRIILVRNTDDEFCSPKIKDTLVAYKNFEYVEIPGYHANYYINSQPYIDLLKRAI